MSRRSSFNLTGQAQSEEDDVSSTSKKARHETLSTSKRKLAVEERGITIEQLEVIYKEIENRCRVEQWKDKDNNLLTPDKVNIYDIKDKVIKESTESDQCSFVESIATEDQKPLWFVSHTWSGSVKSMINCLKKHRTDRKLPDNTPYWICAYANNQHKIEEELATNPFERTLETVTGMITILDTDCVVYKRIWCIFEFYKAHEMKKKKKEFLFDIYTDTIDDNAIGITDGLIDDDYGNTNLKSKRESEFPIERITSAATVDITKAEASNVKDEDYIRRIIAESNVNPKDLNNLLHGIFVSSVLERLLKESTVGVEQYLNNIKQSNVTIINLDFIDCNKTEDIIFQQIADSLPVTLTRFKFYSEGSKIKEESLTKIYSAPTKLPNLVEIKLAYNKMTNDGVEKLVSALIESNNTKLENLDIGVNEITCDGIEIISRKLFPQLQLSLKVLILSKNEINNKGAIYIANALNSDLKGLEILRLSNNKIGDEGAIALANAISGHKKLKVVKMNSNDIGDNGALELATCLSNNQSLIKFYLQHNKFTLKAIIAIANAVKNYTRLKLLSVNKSIGMELELNDIECASIGKQLNDIEFQWKKVNTDIEFFY